MYEYIIKDSVKCDINLSFVKSMNKTLCISVSNLLVKATVETLEGKVVLFNTKANSNIMLPINLNSSRDKISVKLESLDTRISNGRDCTAYIGLI